MKNTAKMLALPTVIAAFLAAALPSTAQLNSHAGKITIIARMPETLGLSLNSSGIAAAGLAASEHNSLGVLTGVTTSWSLEQGRDRVATFAYSDRRNATAGVVANSGISTFGNPAGNRYPQMLSGAALDATTVSSSGRKATKTIDFSDSNELTKPAQLTSLPESSNPGIVKITVQAVL